MEEVFKGVVGSRLYGTASKESDCDYISIVLPSPEDILLLKQPKPVHNIQDNIDTVILPFECLLRGLVKGVPNYWEFVFAHANEMKKAKGLYSVAEYHDKLLTVALPNAYIGMAINAFQKKDFYHAVRAIDSIYMLRDMGRLEFPYKNAERILYFKQTCITDSEQNEIRMKLDSLQASINESRFGRSQEDAIKVRNKIIKSVHSKIIIGGLALLPSWLPPNY